MTLQRDIFIEEIRKKMKKDKKIFFLSADFGAIALDKLRNEFPKNFDAMHNAYRAQQLTDSDG